MSTPVFKCAENEAHVKKANIQVEDVVSVLAFFEHFAVPTKWTVKTVTEACGDGKDIAINHDVAHMVTEDLVIAWKNGHPVLTDDVLNPIMIELDKKQIACKLGEDHD